MVKIPSVKDSPFRLRNSIVNLCMALFAFFLVVFLSVRLWGNPDNNLWIILGTMICGGGIFLGSCVKSYREWGDENKFSPLREPKEIRSWAKSFHSKIDKYITSHALEAGEFRVTFHKIILDKYGREPYELEQVISYVGGPGGKPGRRTSARCGIIGVAARNGALVVGKRVHDNEDSFVAEMVSNWGYLPSEAQLLTPGRRSWIAMPVFGEEDQPAIGVIFADSANGNLFDDEQIQEICWEEAQTLVILLVDCFSKE